MVPSTLRTKAYDAVTALIGGGVNLFSPSLAGRYRYGRELYRTYVAGESTGPNQNYRPRNRSADAEIKRGHKLILARARDQAQNNSNISGGVDKICNNVVRNGIRPQYTIKKRDGSLDAKKNKKMELLFGRWARYADISGHDSFSALQRLILRHVWIDGEVLVHRVFDTSLKGIVPMRLEIIECDHLDSRIDGVLDNGNIARRGIEYDKATSRPLAYHVLDQHPGDYLAFARSSASRRIDAVDMIHVYDRRRASQTRGVSWLAAILMEAYDLSEYKNTERIGARLAAAFGIFVKTNYPDMGPGIGIPNTQTTTGSGSTSWDDMPDYIEPGRIQGLPHGTDIAIASHNRPGNQYEPYVRESVRGQSTGVGMSYEAFSNDYTSATYSSARSASLEERLSYGGQQAFLNEKVNFLVNAWFFEAAFLAGLTPAMPGYAADPLPYHEAHTWQNPGWAWVDPLKDSNAVDKGITNVTTTRTRTSAKLGEDWEEILAEAIREEEQLMELYEKKAANASLQGIGESGNQVIGEKTGNQEIR